MKLQVAPNHEKATPGFEVDVELVPLFVRNYPLAFEAWKVDREADLVSLLLPPGALRGAKPEDLTPESYEELVQEAYKLLAGFFAWCGRRVANQAIRGVAGQVANAVASRGENLLPQPRLRPV